MMRRCLFLIPPLLSSVACSSQDDYARQTGIAQDPAAIGGPGASASAAAAARKSGAAAPVAFADNESRDGATRAFAYSWPARVSAEPALARQLADERARLLAAEKAEWPAALDESSADCGSCRNRSLEKEWKVVADIPGYLSLSADFSSYTGGAHGMFGLQSLVWDRAAQRAVPGAALFRSAEALDAALGPRLCAALDTEREQKRGTPVVRTEDELGFSSCKSTREATVLVGSSTGKAFDRIGVWFGPYVAGPYAEGAYELTFPADAAVVRAVKPAYAAAFAKPPAG